jgi:rhodanese-related sulfurtransferase
MNNELKYDAPVMVHMKQKKEIPMQLLDVRSSAEFADGHARGAISVPLDELDKAFLKKRLGNRKAETQTLYLLCQSGIRAQQAALKLQQEGLNNLVVIEGGTSAWQSDGLPMARSSKLMSLERQTQIAIGVLLMLILFKGLVLHPIFFVLTGFIAGGLIFAGVTARCSLTSIIARMPWNHVKQGSTA